MAVGAAIGGSILSARSNRRASRRASNAQIEAAEIAADVNREALEDTRLARDEAAARLRPFEEFGTSFIPRAQRLFDDPSSAILNNPLFTSLADDAERRLFANQAARGKLGSGGTAEALQNALLRTGQGLISQERADVLNAIGLGQNAAARTGANAISSAANSANIASNIGNLQTQIGNARAAGQIGQANALTGGLNNVASILALSGAFNQNPSAPTGFGASGFEGTFGI